ncbi:MAG: histidinol-phosphate transaminase [Legionellaceae bacterium]|nr:histidinol-phosphate transaminase [Legionellaceae bacterium]
MVNYALLPHQGIQRLRPYQAGKSIEALAKEQGLSGIIKLASNENPLGCSPAVEAYLQTIPRQAMALYPQPQIHPLRAALAEHLMLDEAQIVLANGSDALFGLLLMLFCLHSGKALLTHDYAFITYGLQAQALGIPVHTVGVGNTMTLDMERVIAACTAEVGVLMFANPNNPTGTQITQSELCTLLQAVSPELIVVVDEAYCEFAFGSQAESALPLLAEFPNLVITRTFSKVYGLAGLRLGYALAHPKVAELLWRIQLPFTCSSIAMQAGVIALSDQAFVAQTLEVNRQGMEQLAHGLDALDLPRLPSACNFITFNCRCPALPVYEYLLRRAVITRPLQPYGLEEYIRVTAGTARENDTFLRALADFYAGEEHARD